MQKFKVVTHFLAWGLGAAIAFAMSPAGTSLVHQYPKLAGVTGVLLGAGTLFGVYSQPKTTA